MRNIIASMAVTTTTTSSSMTGAIKIEQDKNTNTNKGENDNNNVDAGIENDGRFKDLLCILYGKAFDVNNNNDEEELIRGSTEVV